MKFIIMLWLLMGGCGISYAVYEERKKRLQLLKEMIQSLEKMAYFMCVWRMPLEEALAQMQNVPLPILHSFYQDILEEVLARREENVGTLWQRKSESFFSFASLSLPIKELWSASFINLGMEPEVIKSNFDYKIAELRVYFTEFEEKYKTEGRLVWTLGVCASLFLCLIIW